MSSKQNSQDLQKLATHIKTNQKMVAVFDAEAFEKEWAEGNVARTAQLKPKKPAYQFRDDTKTGIGYVFDTVSLAKFSKMAADMGLNGQVTLKTYNKKPYVIFQSTGNLPHFVNQLKQRLSKSKHIKAQPQVVQMAIGNAEALRGAVKGGIITFAIFTVVNIIDYIIRDQATFARLAGTIASDFAKISVGVLAGAAAHAGAAFTASMFGITSAITLTLGPIVVAIGVGITIGFLLNSIDDKYKLTEKIILKIDHILENVDNFSYRTKKELNYIERNPIQAFSRIFGTPVLPY